MIEYKSPKTGYRGVLYGKTSMSIYDKDGKEILHTGFRSINTPYELKNYVENWVPKLCKILMEDDMEDDDDDEEI